ncbi:hypothetical protein [Desulfococcus sp.]|uniref:hypothetical protein n=1 Tax=Desulfococcus sp. TaxID=2025834 RepID=UPI0035944BEF
MQEALNPDGRMDLDALADEVRGLHALNPGHARVLIEGYIEDRFKDLGPDRRVEELSRLVRRFAPPGGGASERSSVGARDSEAAILARVFFLIIGEALSPADLSSPEVLNRLAASLNIVFDSLNRLVAVIDDVLYGGREGLRSIRHIIGSQVQGEGDAVSLESYIERIQTAFLDSQQAFQAAAEALAARILSELDPGRVAEAASGGVKFGPFQKAEMFRIYEERFDQCRKWFDSGRFKMELQRAFEKNCEALSKKQGG